ncbi:MAG: phosphomannomutase/phosphoglucomutase [Candidatus Moraniibacteriota bacterium]
MVNPSIFKAYDIRGLYPSEIDASAAYAIGHALVDHFQSKVVAIGRDARESSPELFAELSRGIIDAGAEVIDLGLLTTPMVYFAAWNIDNASAVISVTASHNPPQYNGIKIALRGAVPVGENSGLLAIRDLALADGFSKTPGTGSVTTYNIKPDYYTFIEGFAHLGDRKLKVVIDTANAMGVLELPIFQKFADKLDLVYLYGSLDHPFSAHEANPLNTATLAELQAKVVEEKADIGVAFDGDADRIGFVDERGEIIPMDLITGLLAQEALRKNPGATVLYDLRSSKAVKEVIEEHGGRAVECKVGHANIKKQMREEHAVFAGELSGHYYFQENSYAEAGSLPAILLLNLLSNGDQKLSQLVQDLRRYSHSGEINSEVKNKNEILQTLRKRYADGKQHELDGLKVEYPHWWFNVRTSNTEPLLRLNLEADTPELMAEKQAELLAIIRG